MSKELKVFLIAVLIITAGVFSYILCCGRELTVSLEMPAQATGGSVTAADESIVQVVSNECKDGMMYILLRAVGR